MELFMPIFSTLFPLTIMFAFMFFWGMCYEEKRNKKKSKLEDGLKLIKTWNINDKMYGEIQNITDKEYRYVEVNFKLHNEEGKLIGTQMTNIKNLSPGEVWQFNSYTLSEPCTMTITGIEGNFK